MRILSVELENFQAHKRTRIVLRPIVSIQGPTDAGKSAVLRALRWVCLNDIPGNGFIRDGAKTACVRIRVGLKKQVWEIRRERGTHNTYWLDGKRFKAFGKGMPDPIAKLLRLTELNFQGQHDSPFWLAERGGDVSRQLNAIVDLSVIDTALGNIGATVRQAQERKNVCEERLEQVNKELGELRPQRKRIAEFNALRKLDEEHRKVWKRADRLAGLLAAGVRHQRHADQHAAEAGEGKGLVKLARELVECRTQKAALVALLTDLLQRQKEAEPPPAFRSVTKAFTAWKDVQLKITGLKELIKQTAVRRQRVKDAADAVQNAHTLFKKLTKGKSCPLCGQSL